MVVKEPVQVDVIVVSGLVAHSEVMVEVLVNQEPLASVEIITSSISVPVSYTHLDVYKRQALLSSLSTVFDCVLLLKFGKKSSGVLSSENSP